MTDSLAHLETGESRRLGVQVMAVFPGGPADKAGIQGMELIQYEQEISGDIILAIEEELIDHPSKVNQILSQYRPGDQVILTIFRQNQPLEVPVILQ